MADSQSTCSYKEIRLNLESEVPSSNVVIRLPSFGASTSRTAQKRPHAVDVPAAEDETQFKQRHLATAASIYHRKNFKLPKSFLWRVLDDGKLLTVRVADLCKRDSNNAAELPLTLRFSFPSPIRQNCIALADSAAHNVLHVFALTESNHLYTLTLRPDYFRRVINTEENVADWCKIHLSSAFSFKHPHRLAALSGEDVLVSLHDGGLLKLSQKPGDNGSSWRETFYNAGSWTQGLRSLIPFHSSNTVRQGKVNLELAAVTSIAPETSVIDDIPYLFTVSLDHRLRAWDLESGKVAHVGDILGEERQPNEIGRYTIHPSQSQLVKTCNDPYGKVIVVTYSPIGAGGFKFWTASPGVGGTLNVADMYPDEELTPLAPTSDVWTINDFWPIWHFKTTGTITLWILWKNNVTYRLQRLDFDPDNGVRQAWQGAWESVASETLHDSPLPAIVPSDPTDITEKWLDFILYPGKFTVATIETALSIYERGLGATKELQSRSSKSLPEKLSIVVASTATLNSGSNGVVDYEQFKRAADSQWRRFYRLLLELGKQQGEALSLSYSQEAEMPWIIMADGVSAVRKCGPVEVLWHNPDIVPIDVAEFATSLVNAASSFREAFSDSLLYACNTALNSELFTDPSLTPAERMRVFYDRCNFGGSISDDDWSQLVANMGGSFRDVSLEAYESLLRTMMTAESFDQPESALPLAEFGRKVILKGVQETISLHRMICFDQLVLLIFMQAELDPQDDGFTLDAAEVFTQLLDMLRRLEFIGWLARNKLSITLGEDVERLIASRSKNSANRRPVEEANTTTVLEGCAGHLFGLVTDSGDVPVTLTEMLIDIAASKSHYEIESALTQCYLLQNNRHDLALSMDKFCSKDPFSAYVQGRVFLAAKDLGTAARFFRKAAFELGSPLFRSNDHHSCGLLDATEWGLINSGLPNYYSHIVALFDKERFYSYVIEFASLSLQFIPRTGASEALSHLRTDMHSRLFNAAVQTCLFDVAHSVLGRFTDHALQQAYVRTLVLKMCESGNASQLIKLPFIGLQDSVETVLAQKAHAIVDVNAGIPYHSILYSWRIKHHDFRGAAAIMLERLQRLQQLSNSKTLMLSRSSPDEFDTPITRAFLTTINALSCVDPKQAWILAESVSTNSAGEKEAKRKVVTLADLRQAYQTELDRIAAIENGQFSLISGAEEMEVDVL